MPYTKTINFNDEPTSTQISQLNYVNPAGFKLLIDKLKYKNAQYTIQMASLPNMNVSGAQFNTPQRNIYQPADKAVYAPFEVTFLVDEYLTNYTEIHDWMLGMVNQKDAGVRKTRDITLQIMSSHNNVIKEIQFVDAHPTDLSSLPFDTTITDVQYLVANVVFEYSYFKIL